MAAEVTIVTFRDIFQYEAGKKGRYTYEYRDSSARIILDRQDMEGLGLKDGQRVSVESDAGRVVVIARASEEDSHPGVAFMVNSPWSNRLVGDEAAGSGLPWFKRIRARVSPSEESVTEISEILSDIRSR